MQAWFWIDFRPKKPVLYLLCQVDPVSFPTFYLNYLSTGPRVRSKFKATARGRRKFLPTPRNFDAPCHSGHLHLKIQVGCNGLHGCWEAASLERLCGDCGIIWRFIIWYRFRIQMFLSPSTWSFTPSVICLSGCLIQGWMEPFIRTCIVRFVSLCRPYSGLAVYGYGRVVCRVIWILD